MFPPSLSVERPRLNTAVAQPRDWRRRCSPSTASAAQSEGPCPTGPAGRNRPGAAFWCTRWSALWPDPPPTCVSSSPFSSRSWLKRNSRFFCVVAASSMRRPLCASRRDSLGGCLAALTSDGHGFQREGLLVVGEQGGLIRWWGRHLRCDAIWKTEPV